MAVAEELGDAAVVGQVLAEPDDELAAYGGGELLMGGSRAATSRLAIADCVVPIRA